jgi:hypothetical protein
VLLEIGVLTFDRILLLFPSYRTNNSDLIYCLKKNKRTELARGYVLAYQFGAEGIRILQRSSMEHGTFS